MAGQPLPAPRHNAHQTGKRETRRMTVPAFTTRLAARASMPALIGLLLSLFLSGCGGSSHPPGLTPSLPFDAARPTVTPPIFSGTWAELGPKPLYMASQLMANQTGRVTALLAADPNNLLAGSASGGVWRSSDGGASWTPTSDSLNSLVIGALARDPNNANVILAGTGEPNAPGAYADSAFSTRRRAGIGVYRSADGGASWTFMPGSAALARMGISKVAYDPQDVTSRRIFVSTCRATFGGTNRPFGLYISADGGQTFTSQSTGAAGKLPLNKAVMDIAFRPGDSQTVLATVLDSAAQTGVWRSDDGGNTWSATALVSATYGRVSLAAAPSLVSPAPGTFYALIGMSDYDTFNANVYGSNDNGVTWNPVCPTNSGTTFGGGLDVNIINEASEYCSVIVVDPTTPSTIYIAGNELCRVSGINIAASTWGAGTRLTQGFYDAAGTATGGAAGSPHVDMHAMAFDNAGSLLLGSDGGLSRLVNPSTVPAFPGAAWTNLNGQSAEGRNLGITQLYGVSFNPDATLAWGGFQDNGNGYFIGALHWTQPRSGDGGVPLIVPTHPNIIWQTFNSKSPEVSTDAGVNFGTFGSGNVFNEAEAATFPAPPFVSVRDGDGTRVATARQSVYEVLPGASDYVNASSGPLVTGGEVISALAYAPSDPDVLYVGTSRGRAFVRTQARGAFNEISTGLPGTVVTRPLISGLAVDPTDPTSAWCTVAAYDVAHVLHTADAGVAWTDASGNLPNVPMSCVASLSVGNRSFSLPTVVFVGTETGVYFSQDRGAHWAVAGTGLPNVPVSNFWVNTTKGQLAVATYGRGVWAISLDPSSPVSTPPPGPLATKHAASPSKGLVPASKPLAPLPMLRP